MKYKLLFSILKHEGKEIAVGLNGWAKLTMSESDYQKFKNKMNEVDKYYQKFEEAGLRIKTPIYEQAYFNNIKKDILMGILLEHKIPIKTPQILDFYRNKFKTDPNVIYSEVEIISDDSNFFPHYSTNLGKQLFVYNDE